MQVPTKKTKIVATLGPASDSPETIAKLIELGVNVFRFNMKHNTREWHQERIQRIRSITRDSGDNVAILVDLQGPEIRINTLEQKEVPFEEGQEVVICQTFEGSDALVNIPQPEFFLPLKTGEMITMEDGYFEFEVLENAPNHLRLKALNSGVIKHRKGVNTPGMDIPVPSLVKEDYDRLDMAAAEQVDFVALSFARTKKDLDILRDEMQKRGLNAAVISKIESQAALDHLDELIDHSDAIMVARGDLGIEVPIEQLAYWQKTIIRKCRKVALPVIVATQMLQSMEMYPVPTRAEATDVSNAVFDGTDAVMLSGETTAGKYPKKTVKTMASIVAFTESKTRVADIGLNDLDKPTHAIAHAAIDIIHNPAKPLIDKVVVFTETGYTARVLASFRPIVPVVAITATHAVRSQMSLYYGVDAHVFDIESGTNPYSQANIDLLKEKKIIASDQTVIFVHGNHWKQPGQTNALAIMRIG